jgi:cytoskeleton protein RodZ
MESFGAKLKQERERRGVTLDEIALSTKISTRFLRALEDERFEQLPGGIFNKGFVRAYARHLGMDETQTIADYLEATGETQPAKKADAFESVEVQEVRTEVRKEDNSGGISAIPWGTLAGALLIVAIGLGIWGFYSREKVSKPAEPPSSTTNLPSASPSESSAALPSSTTTAAQSQTSTASPTPQEAPSSTQTSVPGPSSGSTTPGSFTVRVRAREDSWVSITADGNRIMMDTLVAPAERSVEARSSVVVRAGNVGALDFWFNGAKLPPQGDYDEPKTLSFAGNGLQPPVVKTEDTAPTQSPTTPPQ